MTQEITPLGNIFYSYTYQRLAQKRYSNIVENNVTYIYGTDGTSRGRPVFIEDGTGERALSYDALGNVTEEKRIIALPGFEKVCVFSTGYQYDSWGRMLTMTYPDGEVVTYTYSYGGNLKTMYGDKGTAHYDYVTDITYNDFGQRSRIDYGNGTRAAYTYDVLHRLSLLRSVSSSGTMQIIKYTQDGVGNITEVYNRASAIGPLGGTYTNNHYYDALNRLTQSANSDNSYDILMEYSPSGRIAHKTATYSATYSANADLYYGYCDDNQPHAPKRVFNQNDNTLNELMWDIAGNLGQVNTAIDQIYNDTRFLLWTEDNRLHTVVDNNWHSYYAYDHTGERTLKLTGKNSVIDVNADIMMTSSILDAVTLYPSPYVVLSNTGYTKHYYAGSDRLCARIGGGGIVELVQDDRLADRAEMLFQNCLNESLNRQLSGDAPECIQSFGFESGSLRDPIGEAPSMLNTTAKVDLSDFEPEINHYSTANNPEPDVYYYHADHLGSASWITDASGIPLQHLQYLPFGESFINQRATGSSYDERFTFTGKEKDSETGFYYFGARYYDCDLSGLFLSVDPMSDKYPNISPYHYCHWNPVKLVDPDGSEDDNYTIYETGQIYKEETFDNTNTYTYVRNDMTSVDLGTYNVCYNDYGEDVISIGEKSQGNNTMFSWIGINSGNLFFEEDAFAGFLGGVQFFYDNYADYETQPVRVNQMMSSNRIHSHKGGRHSAIDIAYYNSKGVPGAHVDRPKDDVSIFLNGFLAQSLNKFGIGSDAIFTSIDANGSSAFLKGTKAYPGHNTHMHFQGFNNIIYNSFKVGL